MSLSINLDELDIISMPFNMYLDYTRRGYNQSSICDYIGNFFKEDDLSKLFLEEIRIEQGEVFLFIRWRSL